MALSKTRSLSLKKVENQVTKRRSIHVKTTSANITRRTASSRLAQWHIKFLTVLEQLFQVPKRDNVSSCVRFCKRHREQWHGRAFNKGQITRAEASFPPMPRLVWKHSAGGITALDLGGSWQLNLMRKELMQFLELRQKFKFPWKQKRTLSNSCSVFHATFSQ